jgi:hypothetical protein
LARPLWPSLHKESVERFLQEDFRSPQGSRKADILGENSAGTPELRRLKNFIIFTCQKSEIFSKNEKICLK